MKNITDEPQRKRRVAIYIRVSTQEQKIDGYGLESQRKRLVNYVNENKALNLYTQEDWIYEDVHTGSDINRPKLQEMLKAVDEKKFDSVLVWKIDRLSRSLKHLLEIFERLQKSGASFISLQENIDFNGAIGNLIFQIFGAIAQFERELIKSRTHSGIIASAEMGNYTGTSIPYGYKPVKNASGKGRQLEIIPEERDWIRKIYNWYIYEDLGYGQIAKKLNTLKVPLGKHYNRKAANRWTQDHIENIIKRSIYRGEFIPNRKDDEGNLLEEHEWTIVNVPACVSDTTFELAQSKRSEKRGAKQSEYDYLLSGKLYDVSLPKHPKFSGKPRSKGGRSYRRKQFSRDGQHYQVFEIPIEPIEQAVWEKVRLALKDPEVFIKHYFNNEKYGKSRLDDMNIELVKLRERKANLELETDRIETAYESGSYGQEKMEKKVQEKNEELTKIDNCIEEIKKELMIASLKEKEIAGLRHASEQVHYNLDNLGRKQKKILIDLFVDRVELNRTEMPSTGKRKKWDITAKVKFRFVPHKFPRSGNMGSTKKADQDNKKPQKENPSKDFGGLAWT